MLKYLIPLFALLITPIVAHADTPQPAPKPSYQKTTYPALNEAVSSRGLFDDSISIDHERLQGSSKVTLSKNYPIVPYDPNHPNVKKQAQFDIKAKAKTLAGRFGKGLNAVALGVAVAELIGEGIDWVLDPENNSVVYSDGYIWIDFHQNIHQTKESAANYNCKIMGPVCNSVTLIKQSSYNESIYDVYISSSNPAITEAPSITKLKSQDKKRIPLETVAQHVINNENITNNITNNYYDAVNDTLTEQIQKGEHDEAIKEAVKRLTDDKDDTDTGNATDTNTETDGKTDTQDETKPLGSELKFPDFCTWAKPVCDFIEWFRDESPEPEDPKNVPKTDLSDLGIDDKRFQNHVDFGGSCPSGSFEFNANGRFYSKTIPYHHFCNLLILLRPWLLAFTYLISAFFVVENL